MKTTYKFLIVLSIAAGCSLAARARPAPSAAQYGQNTTAQTAPAAVQAKPAPLTEEEIVRLVKKNKKHLDRIGSELTQRGAAFDVTPQIEQELRKAGADDNFIGQVKNLGPTARSMTTGGVSAAENEGLRKINTELDPDRKIQLVEGFAKQFPDSKVLTYAYFLGESAYLQKGDLEHALEYGDKSLKLKPDNLNALMLTASLLPQPQSLKDDPDPERKLAQAQADATKALELIAQMTKQPSEAAEQFEQRKAEYAEGMHSALGMVHLQRAMQGLTGVDPDELAKAENEYKLAVAATASSKAEDYFRLGEVYTYEKKKPEALQAFNKVMELSADNPTLKSYAEQRIGQLKAGK